MKKQSSLYQLLKEVINIILRFFKPYGLKSDILSIPENIRKLGLKIGAMNFSVTIITLVFAFMLKVTNILIEYKLILLGLIIFMLYKGQQVIRTAFTLIQDSESQKFNLIFEDEVVLRGSQIIGKVSNRVLKYDSLNKIYKILDNESISNSISRYLQTYWNLTINHIFDIVQILSVIVMLIVAIITNNIIPQWLFIPLIIFFALISFFSSAYISIKTDEFFKNQREYDDKQSIIANDFLRVPNIVNGDLEMRISRFKETMVASNKNLQKFHRNLNLTNLFESSLELFSQYGIIIFYLLSIEWSSISLSTITEITATLVIVETALSYVSRIARTMNNHSEDILRMKNEEEDIKLILDVFHKQSKNISEAKPVKEIKIDPFCISYTKESDNDMPFELISTQPIIISSGEIAVLYGPSGSGKSTFQKLLTGRISLKKNTNIPSTMRFLFYDETLEFGSLSLYDELFCYSKHPNLHKMQEILENLHLWSEFKSNCIDVWDWLKEKKFKNSLSNGQKQRLILAKILYWLDTDIDVLVLDEATSGLDDKVNTDHADAEKILEYIVRYANADKSRIIIISTHQNIDGFKSNLSSEFKFKNFFFVKEGNKNLIKKG